MSKQNLEKRERVIEAVRHGLEGEAAVEFIRESGYAMTTAGIARHLRVMGGRKRVQDLILEGRTNAEILRSCSPDEAEALAAHTPQQEELFEASPDPARRTADDDFESTKITLRIPSDLYEAIRLAARAEGKSRSELITEILTAALSRMPRRDTFEGEEP